jgi:sugar lactone lactonase YvrE
MPWTNVVACIIKLDENPVCKEVASGLRMANGIEISEDGKTVAVVASLDRQIIIYAANPLDFMDPLLEKKRIETMASCDNLIWADANHLLSGCHP